MPPETCSVHAEVASDIAVVKNDIAYIRNKVCRHVEDGDKEGGFRDRLLLLEQSVSELKKAQWARSIVAGVIGGLVGGRLAPDVLNFILKLLIK